MMNVMIVEEQLMIRELYELLLENDCKYHIVRSISNTDMAKIKKKYYSLV